MPELFFIILYPYLTLKGLIFRLEVKFQSFLAKPTHTPDLSSEQFDLTPKEGPLKIVSIKHDFYLIQSYSCLNKMWINALRKAIFGELFVSTPKILD